MSSEPSEAARRPSALTAKGCVVIAVAVVVIPALLVIAVGWISSRDEAGRLDALDRVIDATVPRHSVTVQTHRDDTCSSQVQEVGRTIRVKDGPERGYSHFLRVLTSQGWKRSSQPGVEFIMTKHFDWGDAYFNVFEDFDRHAFEISAGFNCET